MKLINYKNLNNYNFYLEFENQIRGEVNLEKLLSKHLSLDELSSVNLNQEWGCLEFKGGTVDIEPKTLYKFFESQNPLATNKVLIVPQLHCTTTKSDVPSSRE